jgi:hypothetical protein
LTADDFAEPGGSERDSAGQRIDEFGPRPLCAPCFVARFPNATFTTGEYPPRTCTNCGCITNHGLVG